MAKRVLKVFDAVTGKHLHTVTHVHFQAWDDSEVPNEDDWDDLMKILQI